jgi:hypothetical protein
MVRGDYVRVKASGATGTVIEASKFDVVVRLDIRTDKERAAYGPFVSLPHEAVELISYPAEGR